MSCRSTTCCSAPRNSSSRSRDVEPQHHRQSGTHPRCRCPRPSGDGRTCLPATAPAGRYRPHSPPRRPPPPRSGRSAPGQLGQRHHVRRDLLRPGRDQVRRHRHLRRRGRRGQPGRGRRLEQRPHRNRHPPLAQPLHQRHRQQRMPTQAEDSSSVGADPPRCQSTPSTSIWLTAASPAANARPSRRSHPHADLVQAEHLANAADDLFGTVRAPPPAGVVGAGSAVRSIFPLGVSGSSSRTTTAAGTM